MLLTFFSEFFNIWELFEALISNSNDKNSIEGKNQSGITNLIRLLSCAITKWNFLHFVNISSDGSCIRYDSAEFMA